MVILHTFQPIFKQSYRDVSFFLWSNHSDIWNIYSFVIFLLKNDVLGYFSKKKCINLDFKCLFK